MIGVGLDAVDIERFRAVLARRPSMLGRIFSDQERSDVAGRADPVPGLAARFAAKEATLKALGLPLFAVALADISVQTMPSGAPELCLSGRAALIAKEKGATQFAVSLTHSENLAGAIVLAL